MYVVLVGYGRVGYHLSRALLAIGHEVLVIERDRARCDTMQQELGSIALHGDGTDVQVLKKAGISRADVLIATAGDEDNLAACQIAKSMLGNPRTIALVREPENDAFFKLLGVDVVVDSTRQVLTTIEEELPGRTLLHLMNLKSTDVRMVSISLPEDSSALGKPLEEIELPPNSFITLVVKHDGPYLPSDFLVLNADDEVIAVTTADEEQLLHEVLTGAA